MSLGHPVQNPPIRSSSQSTCTAIAATAMAVGALVALVSGFPAIQANLAFIGKASAVTAIVVVGLLAVGYALYYGFKRHPIITKYVVWAQAGIAALLFASLPAAGWIRIFGFELRDDLPGLGSIPVGAGCLTLAIGAVMLAWCRTPLIEIEDRPHVSSIDGKIFVTTMVAMLTVVLPGMIAAAPPKDHAAHAAPVEAAVPAGGTPAAAN